MINVKELETRMQKIPGLQTASWDGIWLPRGLTGSGLQAMDSMVTLFEKHQDWRIEPHYGICKPTEPILQRFPADEDQIKWVNFALRQRAMVLGEVQEKFGTTEFRLKMGNSTPLRMSIDPTIHLGNMRFRLMDDTTSFSDGSKIQLGFADIDIVARNVVHVNQIQDFWGYADPETVVYTGDKTRKLRSAVSTRQSKIRNFMGRGRGRAEDRYVRETPGVEELALYGATEILSESGVLTDELLIIVPAAKSTNWGGIGWGDLEGSSIHTNLAISKALEDQPTAERAARKYLKPRPNEDMYGLVRRLSDIAESRLDYEFEDDEEDPYALELIRVGRKKIPLIVFLSELVASRIPDEYREPGDSIEKTLGFNEKSRDSEGLSGDEYKEFMHGLTIRTENYLRSFHPYRTAFSDPILRQSQFEGQRVLHFDDIQSLPFVSQVEIEPIKN